MAQIPYRANLSAANYPFSLSRAGRAVIIPQADQNYDRRVDPTGEQKTPGIPQAIYMENVLPTPEGYRSVGYKELPDLPFTGAVVVLEIKSTKSNTSEILVFKQGSFSVRRWNGSTWEIITVSGTAGAPAFGSQTQFSYAIVNDTILIFDGDNIWSYVLTGASYPYAGNLIRVDGITASLSIFNPAGTLTNLKAITSCYGYLILLKDDGTQVSVLWSSLLAYNDFVPSLVTGSGGGAVTDVQGRGVTLRANARGFYLYNSNNIVQALYTGNARYPFKFSPVLNAPGIQDTNAIYSDLDESSQFYITRFRGINEINGDQTNQLAPELTEFMERFTTVDRFNYATNIFSQESVPEVLRDISKIYVYGSRYILLSVATEETMVGDLQQYSILYVYDTLLRRYGKLDLNHTHVFSCHEGPLTDSIGLINEQTQKAYSVNFDTSLSGLAPYTEMRGVLLLGKFQYVRSRNLVLEEVEFEEGVASKVSMRVLPSREGKEFLPAVTPFVKSEGLLCSYLVHTEARNHSILIKGAFDVNTVQLKFHIGGDS